MSPSSGVDREGNFSDMSQHAHTTCLTCYYLVKRYTARVQSPCKVGLLP